MRLRTSTWAARASASPDGSRGPAATEQIAGTALAVAVWAFFASSPGGGVGAGPPRAVAASCTTFTTTLLIATEHRLAHLSDCAVTVVVPLVKASPELFLTR